MNPPDYQSILNIKSKRNYVQLPSWASFFINAGRWMRHVSSNQKRVFLILLLPKKHLSSAFLSLGASIESSIQKTVNDNSWLDFEKLETGTKVYLLVDHKSSKVRAEAELGDFIEEYDTKWRIVRLIANRKALKGLVLKISKSNFQDYHISMTEHVSQHKLGKLSKAYRFYRNISPEFQESWIDYNGFDSIVVTNKAAFFREVKTISLTFDDVENIKNFVPLSTLLMSGDEDKTETKTRIISPRSIKNTISAPLTILDGSDALKAITEVYPSNVVVTLDVSEYDQECSDIIKDYSMYREGSQMPKVPHSLFQKNLDIQASAFAFSRVD